METTVALDVDAKGFVYLTGATGSPEFPLKNAFQTALRGAVDGFVLKMSKNGKDLVYASYIGGSGSEACTSIRADRTGAATFGGKTTSRDFPRKNAFQKTCGGSEDGFVAKVSPDGRSLLSSTYLGGSSDDRVDALAVDASGSAILAGRTDSRNFPVKNAFQKTNGGDGDGFITVMTPAGNALAYSSYMGGPAYDWARDVAVDADGACYVTGQTFGTFPVKSPFQKKRGGLLDAFILKVDPKKKTLVYSSYLGGVEGDYGAGIAVDGTGAAYIVGGTQSQNFPVKSPYQASRRGTQDAFLTIVDPGGAKLILSTFLGGIILEIGYDVALGSNGDILVGGTTNSPDIPSAGKAYQKALAGSFDAFVLKLRQGSAAGRK
ncbi:MAG: SBBP repeat-containing protein [Candidatus Aminicenantes bacterium]|nr:SBBP repeat-containing protein [Candidatus Aminicenantes bacterium]